MIKQSSAILTIRFLVSFVLTFLSAESIHLQAQAVEGESPDTSVLSVKQPGISYTSKGFEMTSGDGDYTMQIQWRFQFRAALPADPVWANLSQGATNEQYYMGIRRARLKVGGHGFAPWLKYYMEYELASSKLLDFRIMVEKYPWLNLKIGQWKVHYNRERVISSGKQQMMDRSILTYFFTIDRQQGISIYGRLNNGGLADFNYWLALLNGTGRGSGLNMKGNAMYMGRLQWNFLGEPVPFMGSDLERREKPVGELSLAGLSNRSAYTRFSQAGGGSLERFPLGTNDQYGLKQLLIESAFMYRGLSWQQELHFKRIEDFVNTSTTDMAGNYMQAGYFFNQLIGWVPEKLEMAFRHAILDPDRSLQDDLVNEFSLVLNYFFKGHHNKLTAEVNIHHFQPLYPGVKNETQFRLQWDISF